MDLFTRRNIMSAGAGALSAALLAQPAGAADPEAPRTPDRKPKILVVGAHPDDPESGAGGTIAKYADLGHEVVACYATRGEAGIHGKSHEQAAAIRTEEAKKASAILKARPIFAGQIDGATELTNTRYDEFHGLIDGEKPDIVITHWPLDTHRDHRATSLLCYDSWLYYQRRFALFYFEVMSGEQTNLFHPTHYVDITATEPRKKAAIMAHASQKPEEWYPYHALMNEFRGKEHNCRYAEAFTRHDQNLSELL
jgi:LmbE family N-acetylglucosaminyl deacetylase